MPRRDVLDAVSDAHRVAKGQRRRISEKRTTLDLGHVLDGLVPVRAVLPADQAC